MAEENLGKPIVSKKERLIIILDKLKPSIDLMERLVGLIKKYQILLSEPRLLFKYRKDLIALLIAIELYNTYKSQGQLSREYIEDTIKKIQAYDEAFAEEVRKILPFVKSESNIFADLFQAYSKGREYLIAYISTQVRELITRAKSIEDSELSKRLIALFSAISGHEVEYLIRYRNEVDNWGNMRYSINYRINFFIRRLNLYLKGGFEDNMQFMGLYKDFGDVELTKETLKNNEIRNLWRYNEQLRYLNYLINLCKKSEVSGRWEGFYGKDGFWGKEGDAKGKNLDKYAKEFETKYGNIEFREMLEAQKWRIGENPEGWGGVWQGDKLVKHGFLHQLLATLQNLQYQRPKIIIPAAIALSQIFKKKEDELLKGRDKSTTNLITMLSELSGVGLNKENILKKFRRFLEKRKWRLAKIAELETNELVTKAASPLLEYDAFSQQQRTVMAKVDLDFRVNRMKKLALSAISNSKYVIIKQRTDEFLRNLGDLVRLDGASGSIAEASLEIMELMEFMHLNENDFKEMEKLIPKAADVVRKLRNFIIAYLKKEIERKFTITIDYIENLPIDITKPQQKYEAMAKVA